MNKKVLINQPFFQELLQNKKIVVLDGGARGDIFKPFGDVYPEFLKVVKFEPDAGAEVKMEGDDLVYPKALWDKKATLELNVAHQPRCSSVFEFNNALQESIDPDIKLRQTAKKVKVEAVNLDSLIPDGLELDFIKLDIHGAEFQVLDGASEMLKNTLGLLIESWTIPIHLDQKLRCHVESLAYENEFYLFEEVGRANWSRRVSGFDKKQMIAVDSLYFKDPTLHKGTYSKSKALKLIGLSQLFNHSAYTIQLIKHFNKLELLTNSEVELLSKFVNKNDKDGFIFSKMRKALTHLNYFFSDSSFK